MAVLPVHTRSERALFKLLLADPQGLFAGRKEPNWIDVAKLWSSHADGISIFYKVSCLSIGYSLQQRAFTDFFPSLAGRASEEPLEDLW